MGCFEVNRAFLNRASTLRDACSATWFGFAIDRLVAHGGAMLPGRARQALGAFSVVLELFRAQALEIAPSNGYRALYLSLRSLR